MSREEPRPSPLAELAVVQRPETTDLSVLVVDAAMDVLTRFERFEVRLQSLEGIPPMLRRSSAVDLPNQRPGDIQWVDSEDEIRSLGFVRRMLGYHTSPLEREILTWYGCSNEPYRDAAKSQTHARAIQRFVDLGLLYMGKGGIEGNRLALRVYLEALNSVPLPVQRWVTPSEEP